MYKAAPIPLPWARDGAGELLSPAAFAEASGLSLSTVWRRIRTGELRSRKIKGRRYVSADAASRAKPSTPLLWDDNHPMWKFLGCAKSGGAGPGSADKYSLLLDDEYARRR